MKMAGRDSGLLSGIAFTCILLGACAATPVLDTKAVNSAVTPEAVVLNAEPYQGKTVQWGGQIIAVQNLPQVTEVQVLAYPLNDRGIPRSRAKPIGRFLLRHPGLLDPLDYSAGRWLSSVGTITDLVTITIGQATSKLPVIQDQQIKLWRDEPVQPRVVPQFGIGIGIGF